LSKSCVVNYKLSNYRKPEYEKTLQWNDPDININWPINKPIMSNKDKNNSQSFNELFNL
jgi:dTDP-4-dehydrorhamnose 3,5-epimerase